MTRAKAGVWTASVCAATLVLAACGAASPPVASNSRTAAAPTTVSVASSSPVSSSAAPSTTSSSVAPSSTASSTATAPIGAGSSSGSLRTTSTSTSPRSHPDSTTATPNGTRPVIVIDPGHSPTVHHIDRRTGLNVSDYENEPEMHDVYKVALIVRSALQKAGYRVVMTKTSVDERVNLAQRAYIANRVHAALAISIHDQAGNNGGIGFRQGNNTVYYQSVGTYRETPAGKKVVFRNKHLAGISKRFGAVFRNQREKAQNAHVNLQGNVGYNLGSRGLAPGNIWIVQLLSKVPWIYNEAGGNSAGRSGLDSADRNTYARGLIAGVEKCVPIPKH